MAEPILITNARVLTLECESVPKRGASMSDLAPIEQAHVLVEDGIISDISPRKIDRDIETIDAQGRVLMPAFVDAHTHACWAGDRLDEWELKQRGASYLELLKSGGGIMSTVRSVRQASEGELAASLRERLAAILREGTTSIEIKSGYGLSTEDELKMLRAIQGAAQSWQGTVKPTACIGHAKDPDSHDFVRTTIEETLPETHRFDPKITIDAYTEEGAWSLEETVELFKAAQELGHPLRIHADQFNALGMVQAAINLGAKSVDHLEATSLESLERLAQSETMGVMLPCSGFQVDGRYANGRAFIDMGGALVIATNVNPGSAPCHSMPMAIALAVRHIGITAAEAIVASTVNAAHLLGLHDRGTVTRGAVADLILLRHRDERQLGYEFGGSHCDAVICGGELVSNIKP